MKSQRTLIILLLVVAILGLGIAYAAISNQTLNVVGNVTTTTSDANFDVHFINEGEYTTSIVGTAVSKADITAEIDESNPKKVTINAEGLDTEGDLFEVTLYIKNDSSQDVTAEILMPTMEKANADWYTITSSFGKTELAKGEVTTLTITVRLNDTPVTDAEVAASHCTFTYTLTAQPK